MSNIQKIIKINLIKSINGLNLVTYLNIFSEIITEYLSNKIIWDYLKDNKAINEIDYCVFKNLTYLASNKEIVNELENLYILNLSKKGYQYNKKENSIDILSAKHDDPLITFTKKYLPRSFRISSEFKLINFERINGKYVSTWNNNSNNLYYFKKIILLDDHNEKIDYYKIDKIEFSFDNNIITTWYGLPLLKDESFEMNNLIPLNNKKYKFSIETDFKINEIYIQLCYEDVNFKEKYIENNFLDYDFELFYSGDLNEDLKLKNKSGYYKEIRFCLIDNLSKQKINPKIIKKISIDKLVKNMPTSLLKFQDNVLIFDYGTDILNNDLSTGFILHFNSKINLVLKEDLELDFFNDVSFLIFGKKHVQHNLSFITI